ncbi:MAG: hypothetical protein AB8B53_10725 [Flavobacteriales bacterium]
MNDVKKATALAAAFLSISCTFASEGSQSNTAHVIASRGVADASHISSEPNGKAALLYDYNDMVMIDLGQIIPKGESYSIKWRKKSYSESAPAATLKVMESCSKTNFSPQEHLPQTSEKHRFIETEFKAQRATRYIMINVASPLDDAIEVDAVTCLTSTTSSSQKEFSKEDDHNKSNCSLKLNTQQDQNVSKLLFDKNLMATRKEGMVLEQRTLHLSNLSWTFSEYRNKLKQLAIAEEKTGDPPEMTPSYWRTSVLLDIRPPPI